MNADQTPAAQTWEPERYQANAAFVSELGRPVVDLLAPRADERILDLGCGEGTLGEVIAGTGAVVVGIDASAEQVAAARERGLDARVVDAAALTFDDEFDAVFSNAALHWMLDPDAVAAGVHRALRLGGRFVGEFGGAGNVARIIGALREALENRGQDTADLQPWYFPTPEAYSALLSSAGFSVRSIDLISRWTPLETDMAAWIETLAEPMLGLVPRDERPAFLSGVEAVLAPELKDETGTWHADYVRLRFAATKERAA